MRKFMRTSLLLLISLPGIAAARPDFSGFWKIDSHPAMLRPTGGGLPPLLPQARQIYDQNIAARRAGKLDFDTTNVCKAPGLPRQLAMGSGFQWLQSPTEVLVIYQWNHENRLIDVGITHQAQNMYAPLYYGFSTGQWRGDEFWVDSVDFNDATILDDAGLPHSDALHVIERYRLIDGGRELHASITIDDPKTYARPWNFEANFTRQPDNMVMADDVCVERQKLNARPMSNQG